MTAPNVRFVGGPLDGRVQRLVESAQIDGSVVRHVHLHDGPKIETCYRLGYDDESGWEYRLDT